MSFQEGGSVATKSVVKKVKELTDQDLLKAPEREYMSEARNAAVLPPISEGIDLTHGSVGAGTAFA